MLFPFSPLSVWTFLLFYPKMIQRKPLLQSSVYSFPFFYSVGYFHSLSYFKYTNADGCQVNNNLSWSYSSTKFSNTHYIASCDYLINTSYSKCPKLIICFISLLLHQQNCPLTSFQSSFNSKTILQVIQARNSILSSISNCKWILTHSALFIPPFLP